MMKKKYSLALLVICCSLLLFAGCGKRKATKINGHGLTKKNGLLLA
ncbi:hypothetical protein QP357_27645 [Klebsiella pneumoniae]|nr:hypothetical protein [Klebsiella pneumoniae]